MMCTKINIYVTIISQIYMIIKHKGRSFYEKKIREKRYRRYRKKGHIKQACVVDMDVFLDLPISSQAVYFHLGMRAAAADFVSSPKRVTKWSLQNG